MDATELLGTWELSAWTCTRDGEAHGSPFGGEPSGVLIYSADGHMAAVLGQRGEAATGTATLAAASAEARARAASSTVAYAGSWALEGDRVVHRVRVALHPDQVGAELVREARFDGAELVLETAPSVPGAGTCW